MIKKEYINPEMEIVELSKQIQILASSLDTSGDTPQNLAPDFDDEIEF